MGVARLALSPGDRMKDATGAERSWFLREEDILPGENADRLAEAVDDREFVLGGRHQSLDRLLASIPLSCAPVRITRAW